MLPMRQLKYVLNIRLNIAIPYAITLRIALRAIARPSMPPEAPSISQPASDSRQKRAKVLIRLTNNQASRSQAKFYC